MLIDLVQIRIVSVASTCYPMAYNYFWKSLRKNGFRTETPWKAVVGMGRGSVAAAHLDASKRGLTVAVFAAGDDKDCWGGQRLLTVAVIGMITVIVRAGLVRIEVGAVPTRWERG